MNHVAMTRREAIARLAVLFGGTIICGESLLSGSPITGKTVDPHFSSEEHALLDAVGETIIPATDSPGAAAVNIGRFIIMMVTDCYGDREHSVFKEGLRQLDASCVAKYQKNFLACMPMQRKELLQELDSEQRNHHSQKSKDEPEHYFRMLKQLTLLGYFSSEIGCTKALRYLEVPGAYRGDVPYKKGDRAWYEATSRSV